jgi:hypothetical protein
MKGVEILSRDGTARYGRLIVDDQVLLFPAATDTTRLFPALCNRPGTNIPPIEDPEFVSRFLVRDGQQPVPLHIQAPVSIESGDTVITPNWHTLLSRPRDFCQFLDGLKASVPRIPAGISLALHSLRMQQFSFMPDLISLIISQQTVRLHKASSVFLTGSTQRA